MSDYLGHPLSSGVAAWAVRPIALPYAGYASAAPFGSVRVVSGSARTAMLNGNLDDSDAFDAAVIGHRWTVG